MIPEPKRDNSLFTVCVLLIIVIIATIAYIYMSQEPEEERDQWVAEGTEILSPNTTAIILKHEGCDTCRNSAEAIVEGLKRDGANLGTEIVAVETVYDSTEMGRALVTKYNITKLPTVILKKEGQWDGRILSLWFSDAGTVEDDGSLVYREVIPPYYDTTAGSVEGEVEFIYIVDESCEECYNVTLFTLDLVAVFEMYVESESRYDISSVEGKAIASQYNITMIPTFLVSNDASVYPGFEDFWFRYKSTKEEDGWYVFRDVDEIDVEYVQLD
jgi:hypothetical protein